MHAPPSCITHTWALPEAWGLITGLGARHALARSSVIAGSNCSVLPFASACTPADLQFKQPPPSPHLPSSLPALFPPPLWPLHRVPDILTDSRWLFHTANCLNNKQAKRITDFLIGPNSQWSPPQDWRWGISFQTLGNYQDHRAKTHPMHFPGMDCVLSQKQRGGAFCFARREYSSQPLEHQQSHRTFSHM